MMHWTELTSPELGECVDKSCVAVMVLGAIEQHGPHLPLATDLLIGEGLRDATLECLARRRSKVRQSLLLLPSLSIGASQEHSALPGTVSLSPELMAQVLEAVGRSLAAAGGQRLVLLNAHGGNHAAIDNAALALRRTLGLLVVKANYMKLPPPEDILNARELREGLHGGQAETSMMLHLAPELVRQEALADFPMRDGAGDKANLFGPAGRASWAWMAQDLNPQGVVGRADRATADAGERLVAHYGERLADVIEEVAAMPWPINPSSA